MATASLTANVRAERGKGAARKLRQAGNVPAVIYGHGREPQSLALNAREVEQLLEQFAAGSTVIELTSRAQVAKTLIREIQRHPVKRSIVHVDFQELVAGEKVTVSIPLRFTGTADGVRNSGGILEEMMHEVHLRVDPSAIPDHIDVDVTPLTIGHSYPRARPHAPRGRRVLDDAGATVCVCTAPKTVDRSSAGRRVEGAEAAAVAEPELIRKAKAEERGGGQVIGVVLRFLFGRGRPKRQRGARRRADESHRRARQSGQGIRANAPQRRLVGRRPPRRRLAF